MSPFVLQIAIVFLPGIIWATIDARFGRGVRPTEFYLVLRAFLFGLVAHGITFLIYGVLNWPYELPQITEATKPVWGDSPQPIFEARLVHEILMAIGVASILAIGWLYLSNYKIIVRGLQAIRATRRYGDEDVWDYTFNSRDASVEYVHVRDFANELTYAGWVDVYSDSGTQRELTLRDVQVFDFEGIMKYETPRMYLAMKSEDIHIEFPSAGNGAETNGTRSKQN